MEMALYRAHGVSYAEYNQSLDVRINVEKEREKEYKQSMNFASTQDLKL
jgi:hypothetical protein